MLNLTVAPVRERGLKSLMVLLRSRQISRSRKGAWIEISVAITYLNAKYVAPVRERGLKYGRNELPNH